ncbi:MAG: hypothetical protein QE269_11050 [Fimbriimonas sp.]|nr:hypothetical protein [Fimbriimonas sp.]
MVINKQDLNLDDWIVNTPSETLVGKYCLDLEEGALDPEVEAALIRLYRIANNQLRMMIVMALHTAGSGLLEGLMSDRKSSRVESSESEILEIYDRWSQSSA